MTATFVAAGAAATSANGGSPGLPTLAVGDLLLLAVSHKYPAASLTTPSGWTLVGTASGGSGASGADTGDAVISVYYRIATGSGDSPGTLSFSPSATGVYSQIFSYRSGYAAGFATSRFANATGTDTSAGTSWSVTTGSLSVNAAEDDLLVAFTAANTDAYTYSAEAMSQTGTTFGTVVERADGGTSLGDDVNLIVSEHPVTSGSGSGAITFTMTASGSATDAPAGATLVMRVRDGLTTNFPRIHQTEAAAFVTGMTAYPRIHQVEVVAFLPNVSVTITPGVVSGVASIPLSASISPSVVQGTASIGTATFVSSVAIAPSVVSASASVGSSTFTSDVIVSPSVVAASASMGGAGILTGDSTTVSVSTVSAVATVSAPNIFASEEADVIAATATVGAPALSVGSIVSASVVAGAASIATPAIPVIVNRVNAVATVGSVVVSYGPDNDRWQLATTLTGASGTASANMVNATADTDVTYTQPLGATSDTVWFKFTPSGQKHFTASVTAVSVAVVLELIPSESSAPSMPPIRAAAGTTASIDADVTDGALYFLRVSPVTAGNEAAVSVAWSITDRSTSGGGSGTGDLDLVWSQGNAAAGNQIAYTPGTLILSIAGGVPNGTATFTIEGDVTSTVDLDGFGAAEAASVLIPELAAGTYVLTVTSGSFTGTINFTVLNTNGIPGSEGSDTNPTPPAQTGVQKWVLQDPLGTLTTFLFPYNPSNSGNPYGTRPIEGAPTTSPLGVWLEWEGMPKAYEWTVEGYGDTEAFYNTLVSWSLLNRRVWLIDHRQWQYVVTVENFNPTLKRNLAAPWAFTYQLTMLVWSGPEVP